MAWICNKNGVQLCEVKKLSYNGTFMEVSSITVTVESSAPIDFAIGDYIDWDYDGLRYTLDTAAGVEKQARKNSIGNAFVYENLVFLSPLKAADNVDFLDVVIGNTVDFMTNTEFSFYGTAWDYAKRLEANLCRLYGDGSWKVRIWTEGVCYDTAPATLDTGAWENKLVDVSKIKCLGGFQQIYDLWGCAYVFSVVSGVNYVDFYDDFELYAKAWEEQSGSAKVFAYGKGNGLYKIRHTPDADHVLVTRLRAYGSSENLPANYYLNSPNYHVDGNESSELAIANLMLPASEWTKDGVKHPSNAYLEQNTDLYGVREASVAWDGSDEELGEIKPSIQGLTIQDLLDIMGSGEAYRPVERKWPDTSQRIDKIITGAAPTDNGAVAESGYDFTVTESTGSFVSRELSSATGYTDVDFNDLVMGSTPSVSHLAEYRVVPTSENVIVASFDVQSAVASAITDVNATITPYINGVQVDDATIPCLVTSEVISREVGGVEYTKRYFIHLLDTNSAAVVFSTMRTGAVTFKLRAHITYSGQNDRITVLRNEYAVSFNLLRGNKAIDKFFSVIIPQIGFDLSAAVTGNAKLCMRSGYNQPREFPIVPSSVRYDSTTDTWYLRCKRVVDQSTKTYFPNSDTIIDTGDEYYFSGIAMPALYVEIAAQKLLEAAKAWLKLHSKPRMLSSVDVDNKIMAVEGIVLKEGMSLPLNDTDLGITPDSQESRVIDNIRIEEGEASIRTFSITLRDKKEKSSLDAAIRGATSGLATNTSVSDAVSAVESRDHSSLSGRDMPNQHPISAITGLENALASLTFFEEDGDGGVKLKDQYAGLSVKGFVTAGDAGSSGGGGGGGSISDMWLSLKTNNSGDDYYNEKVHAGHLPLGSGFSIDAQTGLINVVATGSVSSVAGVSPVGGDIPTAGLMTALGIANLNNDLATISGCLQSLQSQIDSVASRDNFDELTATAFFTDTASVSNLYVETVLLNGADLATRLSGIDTAIANEVTNRNSAIASAIATEVTNRNTAISNAIGALDSSSEAVSSGYFLTGVTITDGKITGRTQANSISGNAATATRLADGTTRYLWGVSYWASGVPQDVTAAPNLYIGGSKVQTSQVAQSLVGISSISAVVSPGSTDETRIEWDATNHAWHFYGGIYADTFVTAGGAGSSGGGGGEMDVDRMWQSLQNNPADQGYENAEIAPAHIPDVASIYGYLKGNQKITLTGVVTGSGTTSIATSIADGTLSIAKVNGLQAALDGKQATISDLATIRNNASLGATAYGWGNHANAGYLTSANGTTISTALQSLQAQIDAVASRDMFDELSATVLNSDIVTASSAYLEAITATSASITSITGSLSGNATTASYLVNSSYGVGGAYNPVYFSGGRPVALSTTVGSASVPMWLNSGTLTACTPSSLFSGLSSSAATNLSVTVAGQNRTVTLYATYDSASENISDKFGIVSSALQSLQSQVDSVASRNMYDELTATTLFSDMLSVGADASIGGLATIAGGIKLTTTKKIWFDDTHYVELINGYLHTNLPIVSDSYITAGA